MTDEMDKVREQIGAILEAGDMFLSLPDDLAEFIDAPSVKQSRVDQILSIPIEKPCPKKCYPESTGVFVTWSNKLQKVAPCETCKGEGHITITLGELIRRV